MAYNRAPQQIETCQQIPITVNTHQKLDQSRFNEMIRLMGNAKLTGETMRAARDQAASDWRLIKLWGVMNLSEQGK